MQFAGRQVQRTEPLVYQHQSIASAGRNEHHCAHHAGLRERKGLSQGFCPTLTEFLTDMVNAPVLD